MDLDFAHDHLKRSSLDTTQRINVAPVAEPGDMTYPHLRIVRIGQCNCKNDLTNSPHAVRTF